MTQHAKHPSIPGLSATRDGRVFRNGRQLKDRPDKDGYRIFSFWMGSGYLTLRVHRVVLACFRGESNLESDHKDRNRAHNALRNLQYRDVPANRRNVGVRYDSSSGIRNVRYRPSRRKWQAYCRDAGRFKSLGHFQTAREAKQVAETRYGG